MKVFVTGASGFVGSAVVKELLSAGHHVLGMVRGEDAAEKLKAQGAEAHLGNLNDLESIKAGAAKTDAVIHTAFIHDFTDYKAACETDVQVINALGEALAGSDRPMVITSGLGLLTGKTDLLTEDDEPNVSEEVMPRVASEKAVAALVAKGINAYILRLPPTTHGAGDHGFVPMIAGMAKEKGVSAYLGNGENRWPAVHRFDAAVLYRLIIEQKPELKVFHAVAEEGLPFRQIAEAIGKGLGLETVSKTGDEAAAHFTWFKHFASMDVAASSQKTREVTGWEPKEIELLEDIRANYFN